MIAGILSQTDEKGNENPTAFYSKKQNETQKAWYTVEKEAYAVIEALNRFRSWFFGYKSLFHQTIIRCCTLLIR